MKTTHQLHFLGTGTSTGTPMLGCPCPICTSSDPCDQRLRSSLWIRTKTGGSIVIDTSADLRQQLLFWKVDKVDAAIITHDHADHLHGIDDLRPFCFGPPKKQIPIFVSKSIAETLERRFDYIFMAHQLFNAARPVLGGGIPLLSLMPMPLDCQQLHPQKVADEEFQFFLLPHGHTFTSGFIHDSMAYIPDCQSVDQEIIAALASKKLELLVIDCLQINKHDTTSMLRMPLPSAKQLVLSGLALFT